MEFTNTTFIFLFLPAILIVYYNPMIKGRLFRNMLLILASLVFYSCADPILIIILLVSILFNYLCGRRIARGRNSKGILGVSIAANLLVLFFFKYINIILVYFGMYLNGSETEGVRIAFPFGISYYTFSAISYLVDVYRARQKETEKVSLIDVALHICFFGKITSGPIVQFHDSIIEIKERTETFDDLCKGIERFAIGFIKKVMIADCLANLVAACFEASELSVCMAWLGAVAYTIQIYFDFSGYTDMAIGIGSMFGFHFGENFNYPYCATSISDFWKKWHISLTKWFTQYLYIPLGGNRVKSVFRHIFNLFVVWLFTSIWHGSNVTFIVWGLAYFVFQTLEKYTKLGNIVKTKVIGRIYTLVIVSSLWVVFRAGSMQEAINYLGAMFGVGAYAVYDSNTLVEVKNHAIPLVCGIIFSSPILKVLGQKLIYKNAYETLTKICLVTLFFLSVCMVFGAGYSAPLYAGF